MLSFDEFEDPDYNSDLSNDVSVVTVHKADYSADKLKTITKIKCNLIYTSSFLGSRDLKSYQFSFCRRIRKLLVRWMIRYIAFRILWHRMVVLTVIMKC